MKAVPKTKGKASIQEVCACFDLKRDAWYKFHKRQIMRETVVSKVLEFVKEERKDQPRVGTRKLHEVLQPKFESQHIKIGRDCLFDILRVDHYFFS